MPIYEFYCPDNNTVYSFLAKSFTYQDKTPRCPDNPGFKMTKKISRFAFVGKAKEPGEEFDDDMDEAKMEQVMAQLERDMAGFDEDNPDPKQMAHLMRKMSDMTGEKLPGEMEEMVRRLEAGEDPEKLEEEYGDSLDGMDDGDEVGESGGAMRRIRQRIMGPKVDSNLYDMAEFCD